MTDPASTVVILTVAFGDEGPSPCRDNIEERQVKEAKA